MMKYLYIISIALLFLSCEKEQDPEKLNHTIYVRIDGADMPVYMRGNINSNVVLLIVHGGPGGNALEYRFGSWFKAVEENYAVAYWDQRGQGMSHGHYDKSDITIDRMVKDMDAVITVLKAKYGSELSVFALGHSWGGSLTAKYMVTGDLQHNLKGWIDSDGGHDNPKAYIEATKMFIEVANEQIALENSTDFWGKRLNFAMGIDTNNISFDEKLELNYYAHESEMVLYDDGILAKPELEQGLSEYFFGPTNQLTSWITGIQTNKMLEDENEDLSLTDQLHKITIPVLVLWGKYDLVLPPSLAHDVYNKVSSVDKKLVIYEESGHSPMLNNWQEVSDELLLFISANI